MAGKTTTNLIVDVVHSTENITPPPPPHNNGMMMTTTIQRNNLFLIFIARPGTGHGKYFAEFVSGLES